MRYPRSSTSICVSLETCFCLFTLFAKMLLLGGASSSSSSMGQTNRGRQGKIPGRRGDEHLTSKQPPTNHKNNFAHVCWPPRASPDLCWAPKLIFWRDRNTPDAATLTLHASNNFKIDILFLIFFKFSFWVFIYTLPAFPYSRVCVGFLHSSSRSSRNSYGSS